LIKKKKRWLTLLQTAATQDSNEWLKSGFLSKKGRKRWFLFADGDLQWFAKEFPVSGKLNLIFCDI
jgi:hypothetical protein